MENKLYFVNTGSYCVPVYATDEREALGKYKEAHPDDKREYWFNGIARWYPVENRGGKREGAGRPAGERTVSVSVRVSPEAAAILDKQPNKSLFVDSIIRQSSEQ